MNTIDISDEAALLAEIARRRDAANAAAQDPNRDPNLDPALAALGSAQRRSRSPDSEDEPQDEHRQLPPPNEPAPSPAGLTTELGRALKHVLNLSSAADAEAEAFLSTSSPTIHTYRLLLVVLRVFDLLTTLRNENVASYTPSAALKRTAQDYATIWFFAARNFSYRSETMAANIVRLMRQKNVSELPFAHDTGRVAVVEAIINNRLTQLRYHAKEVLMAERHDNTDIATLGKAILSKAKMVKVVAAHYWRFAFLSHATAAFKVALANGQVQDSHYWIYMDAKMARNREICPLSTDLSLLYQTIYTQDIATYGQPNSAFSLTAASNVDDWVNYANQLAEQPVELVQSTQVQASL
ncbi:hypothetical protein GGG16DRAFT_87329 [Schizophyllum commune]